MQEIDCLENNFDIDYIDIDRIIYDRICFENECGWEHYLEYEAWYDMGPWECTSEEFCNRYQQQWEYVCNECSKIVYSHIGVDYHNFNGYFDNKYFGLHIFLENGKKKLWSNDMKIIRKPGLSLNRYLKINDIFKASVEDIFL